MQRRIFLFCNQLSFVVYVLPFGGEIKLLITKSQDDATIAKDTAFDVLPKHRVKLEWKSNRSYNQRISRD